MKIVINYLAFSILILLNNISYSQIVSPPDSSEAMPIQYRRGTDLEQGFHSYKQKYEGKNLNEEKRRLFQLDKAASSTGIWTELNPKVPRVDYLGIYFVNTDTGWACGDLGTIIKTTDGGENWQTLETNTTTPVLKVRSNNGLVVVASGFNGLILRSSDGGDNWSQVTSSVTGDLWGLQMINDTLGWAGGNYNSLTKTTDGGLTWQRVFTPGYDYDYWWIDFLNENYGFIAADGSVLRTTDGGNNWDIIQAGDEYPLFCIDAIDSLHVAAAGYGGMDYPAKNIYSSDGGNTWVDGGELQAFAVNCIKYINVDTGYISLNETGLWKTTNRGQSWNIVDSLVSLYMGEYEFQLFKQENIGYDAGSSLRIYKSEGNFNIWHKSIINDDFSDVSFTSEQKGFVVSSGLIGRVYRTVDAGAHWHPVPGPSGYSLFFTDSLTGYLGSTSLWKTTDGGDSWYETNSLNTYGSINRIFFITQLVGWYITSGGAIFKTIDGGENWIQQYYNSSASFKSIYFTDSLKGWTASRYIFQTIDGGENWIERTDIPIHFSDDIHFIDSVGFVIEFLRLHKSTDNGNNWFTQLNSDYVIRTFGWLSNSHGFIMGDGIYETIDAGSNWDEILDLRHIGLRNLQAPDEYIAYSSGYQGIIYKYLDTTYIPVELISFSANAKSNNVLLTWVTTTETNNRGFEVQKSKSQSSERENIGFVEGNGTTTISHSYSYSDNDVTTGQYFYRLKQIDFDGGFQFSKEIEVIVTSPLEFSLSHNYPNPFNPTTKISYSIPAQGFVKLVIYDVLGKEVVTLVNEEKQAGNYTVELDGSSLSSGVYMYSLISGGFMATKKLVFIK